METTAKPSEEVKTKKSKKEETNWLKYYLFMQDYTHAYVNGTSHYSTYFYREWILGIRLFFLIVIVLFLVFTLTLGGLLGLLKFVIILAILEIVITYIIYKVVTNDSLSGHALRDMKERDRDFLVYKDENNTTRKYPTLRATYDVFLKRKKDDSTGEPI